MQISPIPCRSDNYAYLITCRQTGQAAIVDPTDAEPVVDEIARQGVTLVAILNTHHHFDHVGGNEDLAKQHPDVQIYGHRSDMGRIPGQTQFLEDGDSFKIGNLKFHVSHNPGHTLGAITYYCQDAAFTGDTMFAAGCGRLFEGSPDQMEHSLCKVIGANPPTTKIYFGHEYTMNNLAFAAFLEPGNQAIRAKMEAIRQIRAQGHFSTPSTLAEEWQTNPFMRLDQAAIKQRVREEDPCNDLSPASVLKVIRKMKDHW